jgi:dTDP-4-dehydrorhamnose 3,5-epimerase
MPFEFTRLAIPEVLLIAPRVRTDSRGFFMETYKHSEFAAVGIGETFVQENHSSSVRGVLRGLHFQRAPKAQSKLIRVVSGTIYDVAVDLRPHSPRRGQWVGVDLSAEGRTLMYIPEWCAHGFCVLSDHAEVVYHTSTEYSPEHEAGIMWNDPAVGITWPVPNPIVSDRDKEWPLLAGVR